MEGKKHYKKSLKMNLKYDAIKTILLLFLFSFFIYSTTYFLSPGVNVSVEKGKIIQKSSTFIFSKKFPPNVNADDAYKLTLTSNSFHHIFLKFNYSGTIKAVYGAIVVENGSSYVVLEMNTSKDKKIIYVVGNMVLGPPSIFTTYHVNDMNKTIYKGQNESIYEAGEDSKSKNSSEYQDRHTPQPYQDLENLDSYSTLILVLAIILMVVSSIIIASFYPKEKKNKKLPPSGEIIFEEDI